MKLTPPTFIVFLVSLVLAVLGVLAFQGIFSIIPLQTFWIMTIAYVVLAAGCLFKGI